MYTCNLIICVILTANPVYNIHNSTVGCYINDTFIPCETNLKLMKSGKCEDCEAGRYGCNCSLVCSSNAFGVGCYSTCNCFADEICDPATGCTSNTSVSSYTTDSSNLPRSSPVRSFNFPKNNRLNKFPLSLLVSSTTVVFFSILCAAILIRLKKRVYQREYKKLVNNLHMAETRRTEDDPEYASYNYTDSSIFSNSLRHSNEENTYDHSERGSYNILSLRTRSSMVNENDEGCDVASCSFPHSSYSMSKSKVEELNVGIEPECLINLFHEDEGQKVIYTKWEKETNPKSPTTSINRPKSSIW